MPRRGENIYKRRDGRWEGRILVQNKYHSVYAHSYAEVKKKLRSYSDSIVTAQQAPHNTVSDYSTQWLSSVRLRCKPSTHNKYTNICKNHIVPIIGSIRLSDIKSSDIEEMLEQRTFLSPKTKSDILCVTKMIISFAQQSGCSCRINMKSLAIKLTKSPMRVLSVTEQQTLITSLVSENTLRSAGILLAMFTGIRIGELCALRKRDISLENGIIHIGATMQRIQIDDSKSRTEIIISEPKSACSIRDIPISEIHLVYFKQFYEKLSPNAFILTGESEHFTEPAALRYYYRKITNSCGLVDVHFHTLRHQYVKYTTKKYLIFFKLFFKPVLAA